MTIKYFILLLFCGLSRTAAAQCSGGCMNIELKNTGNTLEAWLTPQANYTAVAVSGLRFTISWSASYNANLGTATALVATIPLGQSNGPTTSNSKVYVTYSANSFATMNFTNGTAIKVLTVPVSLPTNVPMGSFNVTNDAYISSNNLDYYAELGGADKTGNTTSSVTAITLPLELATFSGNTEGSANRLNWTTKAERHVAQFTIERSFDGQNDWQTLGLPIKAVGNSSNTQTYTFLDNKPFELGYYRLKTLDFDGKTTLSNIISIQRPTEKRQTIKLSPNPTSNWLNLEFDSREVAAFTATIVDVQGRILSKTVINGQIGLNYSALNVAQLPAGLYTLILSNTKQRTTKQFIKQ